MDDHSLLILTVGGYLFFQFACKYICLVKECRRMLQIFSIISSPPSQPLKSWFHPCLQSCPLVEWFGWSDAIHVAPILLIFFFEISWDKNQLS